MLSSCVGAVVQSSLVPQDRSAALAGSASQIYPARTALYVQGTTNTGTTSNTDQAIPGMSIMLPAATTTLHNALITFSAPTTYAAQGADCVFTIYNGSNATSASSESYDTNTAYALFTSTSIVVRIPLSTTAQNILAEYRTATSGQCTIAHFYSLSAILTG
jgi:hypothetical protein